MYAYVREYIDYDYISELSEEEKDWLDQFSREYYGNSIKKYRSLHGRVKVRKKDLFQANNARRRDAMVQFKREKLLHTDKDYIDALISSGEEKSIIDCIDLKRELQAQKLNKDDDNERS